MNEVVPVFNVTVPPIVAIPVTVNAPAAPVKLLAAPIVVKLPPNTVMAQEKMGGNIVEEITPDDVDIPPTIIEEINPLQLILPKPSPTPSPLVFIPGVGSAPSPSPSPSPSPDADITAPQTTITSTSTASVATTTMSFIFTSSESGSTFECDIDNATSTCVSPKEYTNLSEGSHVFKISAIDAAGNQDATPAERSWSISLSAPSLSNISSAPTRNSVVISWNSNKAGIFQVEYGTSTSYGFLSATTSASTLTLSSLAPATAYHYRLLAEDDLSNATTTSDYNFETSGLAENVVISEIKIGNVGEADDEWIELYNPTNADIDLKSLPLKLHIRNSVGTDNSKIINFTRSVIPAKGFFLLASATNYTGGVPADATYSTSGIKLVSSGGIYISMSAASSTNVIDQVGWGSQPFDGYENTAFTDNPSTIQSLERKAFSNSTSSAMVNGIHQWLGNGYDSDNNSQDFVLQGTPNPQNSLMLSEPRSSLPNLMTASSWPTWQKDLVRTGQTSAVSLATSTMV
ncbi:MAG: lamin tail domain-containing protein, partial [Patescibacteria group bacterium]